MTAFTPVKEEEVLIINPGFDNAPYSSTSCHTNLRKKPSEWPTLSAALGAFH